MKLRKWIPLLLAAVGALILCVIIIGPSKVANFMFDTGSHFESDNNYENEIVFDGDHYKLEHQLIGELSSELFISLPDLITIAKVKINEHGNSTTVSYLNNELTYHEGIIQNSNVKEDEVQEYKQKDGVVYLPKSHIEKYLGIKISYYQDPKLHTISLSSPLEQQKNKIDKEIGTTIFLHKSNVPLSKYEPRDGIYLGSYVIQDEYIDADMKRFNDIVGKKHATFFRYVGYGQPFPIEWAQEVIEAGGFPQIAWEPNNGLEEIQDNTYMREFAKTANSLEVPVLLRYASEMNGTWTAYSGDPDLYIDKWKIVHDVMEEEAPNVMMLWNVFTMPENTIDDYYPGDDYVDYVGVNIYNVVYHNDRLEDKSDFEDPLRLLDYVYNTYSDRKPIVIGEFGATNYTVTDGLYHVDFAEEKISRMYKYLPKLYPRVKFIYYFDVNNLVNAPEGRKINNYAITENYRIINAYSSQIQNKSYLSDVQNSVSKEETFSYRDFLFFYQDKLYVDIQFVQDYLLMDINELKEEQYELTYNGEKLTVNGSSLQINKAAFFEKRTVAGIPLLEILEAFKVEYNYDDNGDLHIYY